ncbi:ribosome-associated translation inhibitor RaiA [Candidatus Wolfebacteria bacterium]|nr:ribosome-associated translation inhibitor RaiA [Candidatus Wolfebacteria bacterium]
MRIVITATQLDLTPALKEYIEKKIGSLAPYLKRFETTADIEVEIEVARTTRHHQKGNVFYAEGNIRLLDSRIRAERRAPDIRVAIDAVRNTLQQEIAKYKEKKIVKRGKIRP